MATQDFQFALKSVWSSNTTIKLAFHRL